MKYRLLLAFCLLLSAVKAQEYVLDAQRFQSVIANQAARSGAESTHNQYLGKINTDIENINTNVGSVVLAQTIIYNGLSQVNSALKDGLAVKNIAVISADILNYLEQALTLARSDPALLLVASNIENEMRLKAIALVSDVSGYILKSGSDVLADFNSRDELLKKVISQLQIIDGLAYGAWRAMFWAKERGIIATINPFREFINKDKNYVNQIILNAKYLHQ